MILYNARSYVAVVCNFGGALYFKVLPETLFVSGIGYLSYHFDSQMSLSGVKVALSLLTFLIVFKSNLANSRYMEGRAGIGEVIEGSRGLTMLATTHSKTSNHVAQETCQDIVRYANLLFELVKQQLRHSPNIADVQRLGTEQEVHLLKRFHRPVLLPMLWLRQSIFKLRQMGHISDEGLELMDLEVAKMLRGWMQTDKVRNTPIPFGYAQMLKFMLVLIVSVAPMALQSSCGSYTPLVAFVVALGFFGVDRVAAEIEEPFGTDPNDLPVDGLGMAVDQDTMDLLCAMGAVANKSDDMQAQELLNMIPHRLDPEDAGLASGQNRQRRGNGNRRSQRRRPQSKHTGTKSFRESASDTARSYRNEWES